MRRLVRLSVLLLPVFVMGAAAPVGPPAPAVPAGHLELYTIAALSAGERVDVRVEPAGCSPRPARYQWSLSSNGRLVAASGQTASVVFLGPNGNRGRMLGAVDVRAVDGPCAGLTAHASLLVGAADPELYNPSLDDDGEATTPSTAPIAPGVTPDSGICMYVPAQSLYWAPGLASSGRLEVRLLGQSDGCGRGPDTPAGAAQRPLK